MKKSVAFLYGFNSVVSKKALADGFCASQQDLINAPLAAISSRPGYLKKNTTALGGEVNGLYLLKTKLFHTYLCVDSAGNINTI